MRRIFSLLCVICLSAGLIAVDSSSAFAQQMRVVKQTLLPDQWAVSYSRQSGPDAFEFDTAHASEDAAIQRAAALRAWSAHISQAESDLTLAVILVEAEKKENRPVPDPPDAKSSKSKTLPNPRTGGPVPNVLEQKAASPVFSKFRAEVETTTSKDVPKVAGRRFQGTLGKTKVIVDFDGDDTFKIKDADGKPLNSGRWFQTDAVLSFATEGFVYIGNVGSEKAKGLRMSNGLRLGSDEDEWNLVVATADPIVGTWQLITRKVGKNYGDTEQVSSTTLTFKLDHTVTVDWNLKSSRMGWDRPARTTDFDRSTANWELREGKIHFSNPKVIKNWNGHDEKWSWFDPKHPLYVENLVTWNRLN